MCFPSNLHSGAGDPEGQDQQRQTDPCPTNQQEPGAVKSPEASHQEQDRPQRPIQRAYRAIRNRLRTHWSLFQATPPEAWNAFFGAWMVLFTFALVKTSR